MQFFAIGGYILKLENKHVAVLKLTSTALNVSNASRYIVSKIHKNIHVSCTEKKEEEEQSMPC